MSPAEILLTVFLTVLVQIPVLVALYQCYIIPRIVTSVRDELMEKIEQWVQSIKTDMSATISDKVGEMAVSVGDKFDTAKASILGAFGAAKSRSRKLEKDAREFLDSNLGDDILVDSPAYDSIVNEAIINYGASIVKAILAARRTAESPKEVW